MFAVAKYILDVSLGSHHTNSIEACINLSRAYCDMAMGSYTLAIEFQQRAIDAWESHGPSAEDELKEAHRVLEQLKSKAHDASTNQLHTKALPLPLSHANQSRKSLQPDVSVNQKQTNSV